jgi:hypothetical protein
MFNDHAINIYQAYLLTVVDDFLRKWLLQDVGILNKTPTSRLMLLTVLENIEDIQLAFIERFLISCATILIFTRSLLIPPSSTLDKSVEYSLTRYGFFAILGVI